MNQLCEYARVPMTQLRRVDDQLYATSSILYSDANGTTHDRGASERAPQHDRLRHAHRQLHGAAH